MVDILQRFGQRKRIIILGVLILVNTILFNIPGFPGSIPNIIQNHQDAVVPDMSVALKTDDIYQFLSLIGQDGRLQYQLMHLGTDLIFPILYALFIFSFLSRLILNAQGTWIAKLPSRFLLVLAFIPTGFDLIENFILVYVTEKFPDYFGTLMQISRIATSGKFSFLILDVTIIGYLVIRNLAVKNKRPGT